MAKGEECWGMRRRSCQTVKRHKPRNAPTGTGLPWSPPKFRILQFGAREELASGPCFAGNKSSSKVLLELVFTVREAEPRLVDSAEMAAAAYSRHGFAIPDHSRASVRNAFRMLNHHSKRNGSSVLHWSLRKLHSKNPSFVNTHDECKYSSVS